MASAIHVSDHIPSSFPDLQKRLDRFREVIKSKKLRVKKLSQEMKYLISNKENDMISQLDKAWDDVIIQLDEFENKKQKLNNHKMEMEKLFQELKQSTSSIESVSLSIEAAMNDLDLNIPYVSLFWAIDVLEDSIDNMCIYEQQDNSIQKNTEFQLELDKFTDSPEDPWGIAIDSANDLVYIADRTFDKVKIFCRNYGTCIGCIEGEKLQFPENIILKHNSVIVQCSKSIHKIDSLTLNTELTILSDSLLAGLCID